MGVEQTPAANVAASAVLSMPEIVGLVGLVLSLVLATVLFFSKPEAARRWLRRLLRRLLRRHPSAAIKDDIAVFAGRVELLTDELLSHPADAARTRQFYEGSPLDWDIIAAGADIERDLQDYVVAQLSQPVRALRFVCLRGESCSGKSTLAWRAAAELHARHRALVLRVRDKEDPEVWYQMAQFATTLRQPVYVIADDIFRHPEVRRALRELNAWLPVTVIATSQTNEYSAEGLKTEVVPIPLGPPTAAEKSRLLVKLGLKPEDLTPEQMKRMEVASEFLVVMVELTAGKEFRTIVQDSLDNLLRLHESIYRAYEYLCFSYSYEIAIPATLIGRMDHSGAFRDLPDRKGAQGLIFRHEDRPQHLRPGNTLRAKLVMELFETRRSPALVLCELVKAVDVSSAQERDYIAFLLLALARHRRELVDEALPLIQQAASACVGEAGTISEFTKWRALYLALGCPEEAKGCRDIAVTCTPVSSHECGQLVDLFRECGREQDALPVLDRWIHTHTEWGVAGSAYVALVGRLGTPEQIELALEETTTWLAAHKDDTCVRTPYLGLVENYGTSQQVEHIMRQTPTWLAAHPNDSSVRAKYLRMVGRCEMPDLIEGALKEANAWLAAREDDAFVRYAYLGLVEAKGTPRQIEDVLKKTGTWLAAHPNESSVRGVYLGLARSKGTPEQIRRVLQETPASLQTHPDTAGMRILLITRLCDLGRPDDARALAEEAAAIHPTNHDIVMLYLKLLRDHLGESRTGELLDSFIRDFPEISDLKHERALWLRERGLQSEALEAYEALTRECPRSLPAQYGYGRLLLDMESYGGAAERFRLVLAIHRGHAMAHDGLAQALRGQARRAEESGDRAEAARLTSLAECEFKSAAYWAGLGHQRQGVFFCHRGWFYVDAKRWHDAIDVFEQAATESPEYFESYWGKGCALMGLEQWHEAACALRTSLAKGGETLKPPASCDIPQRIERCEGALRDKGAPGQVKYDADQPTEAADGVPPPPTGRA